MLFFYTVYTILHIFYQKVTFLVTFCPRRERCGCHKELLLIKIITFWVAVKVSVLKLWENGAMPCTMIFRVLGSLQTPKNIGKIPKNTKIPKKYRKLYIYIYIYIYRGRRHGRSPIYPPHLLRRSSRRAK